MQTPHFVLDWFQRMPYHQMAELTVWMDQQADLKQAFEKAIGESLPHDEEPPIANPFDTMDWGTIEPSYNPADNGNQGS